MRYHLNTSKLKEIIAQLGYANISDFARANSLNRATLHHYIKGEGGPLAEGYYSICEALNTDPIALLTPVEPPLVDEAGRIMPIVNKLAATDKEIALCLLGSRAKGKGKKYSDWDIGITHGRKTISGVDFLRLKRNVDADVDKLPWEVDFINLDAAPEWFLLGIDYEPIFLAGNSNSWAFFLGVLYGAKKRNQKI